MNNNPGFTAYLPHIALSASSIMLGMSFVAIRIVMDQHAIPATLGFLRYGLAVLLLLPLLLFVRRPGPPTKIVLVLAGLGIIQFGFFHLFVNTALEQMPASRGAVIFSLIPVMTMLFAAMAGRERLTPINLFAATLSIVGVSLAIGEKAFQNQSEIHNWTGEILFFMAVCCGAIYNTFSSRILKVHSIVHATIIGMTAGSTFILIFSFIEGFPSVIASFSTEIWLWIMYLAGPAAALSLFLFNWGLQQLSPSKAAIYVPLAPVAASAFGAFLLGENLSGLFLIGLTFAITGPILTNWRPFRI
ncbi:DMT family transporter [Sneathiella aquimaris]|uniref:DMT family transporter n=1 Tax=Sneathiella aquimaris TaxID=2599305 RepID=UPI00146DEB6C|nr:EamA family transporter [Sneathiella aquimaris]